MIRVRRVYDPATADDGLRVLVDRLWPRGIRKADLHLDLWAKDLAPSTALRTWFCHDAAHFPEFTRRYRHELAQTLAAGHPVLSAARKGTVTLLYAARDPHINHAVVLREVLAALAAEATP